MGAWQFPEETLTGTWVHGNGELGSRAAAESEVIPAEKGQLQAELCYFPE